MRSSRQGIMPVPDNLISLSQREPMSGRRTTRVLLFSGCPIGQKSLPGGEDVTSPLTRCALLTESLTQMSIHSDYAHRGLPAEHPTLSNFRRLTERWEVITHESLYVPII